MNCLRQKGVILSYSYGVTHSSQPNYIVSVAGDCFGFYNDSHGYVQWIYERGTYPITSIVDLLEAQRLTWRAYAEDLPPFYIQEAAQGYPKMIPPDKGNFARKHVPYLSFPNIITNPDRLANIVNAAQFEQDLAGRKLPHYSWYTPNLINDGHSLTPEQEKGDPNGENRHFNIENIAAFLEMFLSDDPVAKFPPETLIMITFDEAFPYHDPYEIYTLLIGEMLQAGTTRTELYNHYILLRSIEINFGLGNHKRNDVAARPYWFLQE
jgi:acid phosphatase